MDVKVPTQTAVQAMMVLAQCRCYLMVLIEERPERQPHLGPLVKEADGVMRTIGSTLRRVPCHVCEGAGCPACAYTGDEWREVEDEEDEEEEGGETS